MFKKVIKISIIFFLAFLVSGCQKCIKGHYETVPHTPEGINMVMAIATGNNGNLNIPMGMAMADNSTSTEQYICDQWEEIK